MNAIIQDFEKELSSEERQLFEMNARRAGKSPGEHLKSILFGENASPTRRARAPKKKGAKAA